MNVFGKPNEQNQTCSLFELCHGEKTSDVNRIAKLRQKSEKWKVKGEKTEE